MSDKFHSSSTEVKGLNEKIQNLGGKSASGLYKWVMLVDWLSDDVH